MTNTNGQKPLPLGVPTSPVGKPRTCAQSLSLLGLITANFIPQDAEFYGEIHMYAALNLENVTLYRGRLLSPTNAILAK
jgi:hypothetical protein